MSSLRQRLEGRSWEQDWPNTPPGVALPTFDWVGVLALDPFEQTEAKHRGLAVRQMAQMPALLQGRAHDPLPQAIVHRHLDALEAWNASVTWQATWPPTLEGLGRAIATSITPGNARQTADSLLGVCVFLNAYPELAWAAIQATPKWKRQALPEAWFEVKEVAPPAAEPPAIASAEKPPIKSPPAPSVEAPSVLPSDSKGVTPPGAVPPAAKRARSEPSRPAPKAAPWLAHLLTDLSTSSQAQPLLRQRFDSEIKTQRQSAGASWFEDEFFPAVAQLSPALLKVMLRNWPDGLHFSPADPIGWVKGNALWGQLRDAHESKPILMQQVLPRVVDTRGWTDVSRVLMLRFMVSYAKHDPEVFAQRMALWQSWGGRLDMKAPKARDQGDEAEGNMFDMSRHQTTVLDWIRAQDVPMWNTWTEGKVTEAPMHASMPSALPPAPRTRRSGGP